MRIRFATAVVLLAVSPLAALGQVAPIASPVCNADYAQQLVQQQVTEGKSVTEPVKRIKVLLRSADFLWKFDEPTARSYFSEAWKMADDRFKETGYESKTSGTKDSKLIVTLPDQRMEVVRAISKRDSEWAKKLSDQMLADFEKSVDRNENDKTRELGDLLGLAQQSAKSNPELSRQLFRRVMKYPLFNGWYWALYATYGENASLADSIYSEALTNYRNESPRRLLYLSAYPFVGARIFGPEKYSLGAAPPPGMRPNQTLQRQFLTTFFTRIAAYAASVEEINRAPEANTFLQEPVYMTLALRELEPIMISDLPDMLQRFSVARSQADGLLNEEMKKAAEAQEKQAAGSGATFDERLEALEKAEGEGKLTDYMIINLTVWAKKTDEQFELAKPWLDKIVDQKARSETTNYFWFQRSKLAIKEKRYEDADLYAQKVPELDHRAVLLFEIAGEQSKNDNEFGGLFETLNRISKLNRTAENSVAKAQIQLGLAHMYEKVNHSVAVDELTEAIRITNALKDPDIFSRFISRQITGKGFGFFASFETPGYDLEKTFEDLSKKDFQIALSSARSLDDKYFRTLAVIAVATNCAKNTKPDPKAKPVVKPQPKQ